MTGDAGYRAPMFPSKVDFNFPSLQHPSSYEIDDGHMRARVPYELRYQHPKAHAQYIAILH